MKKQRMLKLLILFWIGFSSYISMEVCFRGYSYVLMGIVGGICTVFASTLNNQISYDMPIVQQALISAVFITLLEVLSGEFAWRILGIRMWDYSGLWGSAIDGFFAPLFSCLWFLLSIGIITVGDCIEYYLFHSPIRPYYRIFRWKGKKYRLPKRECS